MLESRKETPVRVAESPLEVVFVASVRAGSVARSAAQRRRKGKERV